MGRQTKNQAAQRRRQLDLDTPIEPVRITTSEDVEEEERELFLEIDGDEYTILKTVPPRVSVAYLNNVRKRGTEYAIAEAMVALIGEEAMDAMADCDDMTPADLKQVMKAVEKKMLAAQEDTMGN